MSEKEELDSGVVEQITACLLLHLHSQCEHLLYAEKQVWDAWRRADSQSAKNMFFYIQGALSAYASISKVFWPAAHVKQNRQQIRERLSVDKGSFSNRAVRNAFEHADEKIEEHLAKRSPNGGIALRNIGPRRGWLVVNGQESLATQMTMNHFDPGSGIVYFWEMEFDLRQAAIQAGELKRKIESLPDFCA